MGDGGQMLAKRGEMNYLLQPKRIEPKAMICSVGAVLCLKLQVENMSATVCRAQYYFTYTVKNGVVKLHGEI